MKYWDDLSAAEQLRFKELRDAELAALVRARFPFIAYRGKERVKVLGEINMFEPYASAEMRSSKPTDQMMVESRKDGQYIVGAGALKVGGKPLLTPRPPQGRAHGPYPKNSSSTAMSHPDHIHMYVWEKDGSLCRGYIVPDFLPRHHPHFMFGRFGQGGQLRGKIDRRTRSIDQLAVEALVAKFGIKVDVHYRPPMREEKDYDASIGR
jgi:hypothetical protein